MRLDEAGCRTIPRAASRPADWHAGLVRLGSLQLVALDLAVGLGRKAGGFVALLTLGWTYFRLLALGQSLHRLYPHAPDPDLRQTLWVALLLVLAQGWDIPTDRLAADWQRLRGQLPGRPSAAAFASPGFLSLGLPDIGRHAGAIGAAVRAPVAMAMAPAAPVVVRLGRFMDLCVAIANKVGALAALAVLALLAWRMLAEGMDARALYPEARDPATSLLADLCVGVVVVGWWGMPIEQIAVFWRRLLGSDEPAS